MQPSQQFLISAPIHSAAFDSSTNIIFTQYEIPGTWLNRNEKRKMEERLSFPNPTVVVQVILDPNPNATRELRMHVDVRGKARLNKEEEQLACSRLRRNDIQYVRL